MNRLARRLLDSIRGTRCAGLAVVLSTALSGGGCLWWPDIEEREEVSFPPVIDREMLTTPSPDEIVDLTSVSTTFSVAGAVSDADTPLDALEYQWYVGYPEASSPKGPDFTGHTTIAFNACAFQDELSPSGSTHLLELIVSDQPIEYDPEIGRVMTGGYAYVSWTIRSLVACP